MCSFRCKRILYCQVQWHWWQNQIKLSSLECTYKLWASFRKGEMLIGVIVQIMQMYCCVICVFHLSTTRHALNMHSVNYSKIELFWFPFYDRFCYINFKLCANNGYFSNSKSSFKISDI